jgi:septum formation protein
MSVEMILLASNSPRRKQLLALTGWPYRIQPADVNETPLPSEPAEAYVLRLAESKARAAARSAEDGLVLAADTTVVDAGAILGKPNDADQARAMLRQLRGRSHQVLTALAVLQSRTGRLLADVCVTDVPMRAYTETEIEAYVASGDPLDKAGAYAIQHAGFHPVESLAGCYANVVGLPLCHLARTLRKLGLQPRADLPQACQAALGYQCPVYEQILVAS